MRALSVLLLVAACRHASPMNSMVASPMNSALVAPPTNSAMVASPTNSVPVVEKDGAAVWPPQGEGCAAAVACCDAMAALQSGLGLACQLAAAADGPCAELQATTMQIFREIAKREPPCEAP